jgi:hypothetical protein
LPARVQFHGKPVLFSLANNWAMFYRSTYIESPRRKNASQEGFHKQCSIISTEAYVNEVHEIDSERLNAAVIGLAIRLAFLGVVLFLSLSIIRPFF